MYRTLYAHRCGPSCRQACSLSQSANTRKDAHCFGRWATGHLAALLALAKEASECCHGTQLHCLRSLQSSTLPAPLRCFRASSMRSGRKSNDVQGDLRAAACSGNNSVCLQPMTEVDPAFCRIELVWCRCECQLFNLLLATQ